MISFFSLFIFLILHLGSSIYFGYIENVSYRVSPVVCILPAIFFAVLSNKEKIQGNINTVIEGMGNKNIITMCLIFLFSGAFSTVTSSIGSADFIANFTINFLPTKLLLPGIFLISAFISTAIGTSMSVIALVTPIVVILAKGGALGLELGVATVISGAIFGDNLSTISDTTIVAVSSQGSSIRDKLKLNFKVASIAGVITLIYLAAISNSEGIVPKSNLDYSLVITIIPYVILIIMGLFEVNVLITLVISTFTAGVLGIALFDYSIIQYSDDTYKGFKKVNEIMIFFLFMGGLSDLMYAQGKDKLNNLIDKINTVKTKAEFLIAWIVSIVTLLVASNTIAILLSGDIVKRIAQKHNILPHRSAYLLDTFACIVKGILPYGSQLLLAGSLASLSPVSLMTKIYYCFFLLPIVVCEIVISNRTRLTKC